MEQNDRANINCVVVPGTRARTQNGHIRNDTRDVSRRIRTAQIGPISRRMVRRGTTRDLLDALKGSDDSFKREQIDGALDTVKGLCDECEQMLREERP